MHSGVRVISAASLLLVCLGPVARASADPITITGGEVLARNWDELAAHLLAPGFDIAVLTDRSGFNQRIYEPGDTVELSNDVVLDDVDLIGTFEGPGRIDFRFTGGTAEVPPGPVPIDPNGPVFLTFETPFSFVGEVVGFDANGGTAFSAELNGAGRAEFILHAVQPNPPLWDRRVYILSDTNFFFEETAPIPEPGTMLMVGAALAGLAARGRRRLRRSPRLQ